MRSTLYADWNDGADGVGYGVNYPVFGIDCFRPYGVKQHTTFPAA
jgi:hypothetical protein